MCSLCGLRVSVAAGPALSLAKVMQGAGGAACPPLASIRASQAKCPLPAPFPHLPCSSDQSSHTLLSSAPSTHPPQISPVLSFTAYLLPLLVSPPSSPCRPFPMISPPLPAYMAETGHTSIASLMLMACFSAHQLKPGEAVPPSRYSVQGKAKNMPICSESGGTRQSMPICGRTRDTTQGK